MRQEQGLNGLIQSYSGRLTAKNLADLLLEDLEHCHCLIFGRTEDEVAVELAELKIIPGSLYYEMFDQRIEFTVAGEIENNQFVPLTYKVQGNKFGFYGRCSTIPRVCGVDLYLNQSYTQKVGDMVRQNFSVSVKKLFKTLS
ncbi:MAG: hypothetical protein KAR12_06650 [Methylococcales bacterium]|nr:hypothetical protein [Methylococcales bacterium]